VKPPIKLLTLQAIAKTPEGQRQRITYDVYADPEGLADHARRAARNKDRTSRDGAISYRVVAVAPEPEATE
jgi:hypothetical protein